MLKPRAVVACALMCAALLSTSADARKPEDVFGGRVMVSDKPFPFKAASEEAYISAVKGQARDRFDEDKTDKTWRIHYAAFFKAAPNNLEVTVKIFDITNGGKRLVDTFEQYLTSQNKRGFLSSLELKRGDGTSGYEANTKIWIVVEAGGRPIAENTFMLIGEAKKYKGKVSFDESETK